MCTQFLLFKMASHHQAYNGQLREFQRLVKYFSSMKSTFKGYLDTSNIDVIIAMRRDVLNLRHLSRIDECLALVTPY